MPDFSNLNVVDYSVLAVLGISGILATFRGMTREVMGLAGWGLAVVAGRLFKPLIVDRISDTVGNDTASEMIGFIAPFVVVVIVWFIFANITSPGLKKITFGKMDRWLGFFFGVIRGVFIVAISYIAALLVLEREERFPEMLLTSQSIAPVRVIGAALAGYAPDEYRDTLNNSIPEQNLDGVTDQLLNQGQEIGEDLQNSAEEAKDSLLPDEQLPIPEVTE